MACEGRRDLAFLRGFLEQASDDDALPERFAFSELRPNAATAPGGWTRLRKWAKRSGRATLLAKRIDLVLFLIDGDVIRQEELQSLLGLNGKVPFNNADLCNVIKSWISPPSSRNRLIIAIATDELETWILAIEGKLVTETEVDTKQRLYNEVTGASDTDAYFFLMGKRAWVERAALRNGLPEFDRFLQKFSNWLSIWREQT